MSLTNVWLASTSGPVSVTSIHEEAPTVGSVVCLEGTFKALPISNDYDAFVRRPTGIIETLTGHCAYRLDVSSPIDQGKSWQLGFAIAHLVQLTAGKKSKEIIFTSGEIAPDFTIHPVAFMDTKWQKALPELTKASDLGFSIKIVLHEANAAEIRSDIPEQFQIIEPKSLTEAAKALGLPWPQLSATKPKLKSKTAVTFFLGLALIAITFLATLTTPYEMWREWDELEEQGRFREMLISLRNHRQNSGWLVTNAAYFYEKKMHGKSARLSNSSTIKITQSSESENGCMGASLQGKLRDQLPSWLVRPCRYQIHFSELPPEHHVFFSVLIIDENGQAFELARVSGNARQISQAPVHFRARELGQRETFYIISLVTSQPAFEIYNWFNNIIDNPALSKEMRKRLEQSGIGYNIASLVNETFNTSIEDRTN